MAGINAAFSIPSPRGPGIEIPIGVTVPAVAPGTLCPVALLVHGLFSNKDEDGLFAGVVSAQYTTLAEQLLELGIGTIRADMPGYGDSKEPYLTNCLSADVEDFQTAFDYCMARYPFDPQRIGLVGNSKGAKVGMRLICRNP